MSVSLNVIALISGGKDSFFSILHCMQNRHQVVALGNLYPASTLPGAELGEGSDSGENACGDEHDLNSFMFQTVGHTVIPLYEQALAIPLYRQQILGTAVQTGISYSHAEVQLDETESLIPLLRRIMTEHPTANALCTGAILSTYQRTRIESVALRLGLIPLSYLWKYPTLPPGIQSSLLHDMQSVGLDARIVKVASGGLDESFLWENIASDSTVRRVERSMKRFGTDGDGGVLGEGGEFETLVVDGPASLFKGRIEVKEGEKRIVKEGGGSAWLQFQSATVAMKSSTAAANGACRIPDLLEERFKDVFQQLKKDKRIHNQLDTLNQPISSSSLFGTVSSTTTSLKDMRDNTEYWSISADPREQRSISLETQEVVTEIRNRLNTSFLEASDIISATIILRSMEDFGSVNKIYGALFTEPNPPSRVTISCGDMLPLGTSVIIHLKVHKGSSNYPPKKCLHVQSRSYWAPANIGPYSQAISTPLLSPDELEPQIQTWTVNIAGQIPLIPQTMLLPAPPVSDDPYESFKLQTGLSLQHLWRIGKEMNITWWTSAVAYLPRITNTNTPSLITQHATIASQAWAILHDPKANQNSDPNGEEEERDLWEEKYYAGMQNMGGGDNKTENLLPDWSIVEGERSPPPFFAAEVEELPRQCAVEWHAHLGIVQGRIHTHKTTSSPQNSSGRSWTLYQTTINGDITQSLVMIPYSKSILGLDGIVSEALGSVDSGTAAVSSGFRSFSSYIDVSVSDGAIGEVGESAGLEMLGIVPCRSLWDESGRRLAAVVLL